jgi:hypothetical protein
MASKFVLLIILVNCQDPKLLMVFGIDLKGFKEQNVSNQQINVLKVLNQMFQILQLLLQQATAIFVNQNILNSMLIQKIHQFNASI